jgi:hypothetical protein
VFQEDFDNYWESFSKTPEGLVSAFMQCWTLSNPILRYTCSARRLSMHRRERQRSRRRCRLSK